MSRSRAAPLRERLADRSELRVASDSVRVGEDVYRGPCRRGALRAEGSTLGSSCDHAVGGWARRGSPTLGVEVARVGDFDDGGGHVAAEGLVAVIAGILSLAAALHRVESGRRAS